ncbi:MAG: hypothetical protein HKM93_12155 [Desulfobacteraceae bacterium]|nr:hypothetical protein [Desulfobacteraceae bacterium]
MERRTGTGDRRQQHTFVTHERRIGPWERRKISEMIFGKSKKRRAADTENVFVDMYRYKDGNGSLPSFFDPRLWIFLLFIFVMIGIVAVYLRV